MKKSTLYGFTLVETLIYLALFAVLMTGIISSFFATGRSSVFTVTGALLHDEGLWLLDSIRNSWEAHGYSGSVLVPKINHAVRMVNFHVAKQNEITIVSFDLTSTTTSGISRTQSFSETLYPLP